MNSLTMTHKCRLNVMIVTILSDCENFESQPKMLGIAVDVFIMQSVLQI